MSSGLCVLLANSIKLSCFCGIYYKYHIVDLSTAAFEQISIYNWQIYEF